MRTLWLIRVAALLSGAGLLALAGCTGESGKLATQAPAALQPRTNNRAVAPAQAGLGALQSRLVATVIPTDTIQMLGAVMRHGDAAGTGVFRSRPLTALRAADGGLLWKGSPVKPSGLAFAGPIAVHGTVFAAYQTLHTDSTDPTQMFENTGIDLYALDAATGKTKWVFSGGAYGNPGIAYSNGVVYFTPGSGTLYALVAGTGSELWHYEQESANFEFLTVAGDEVFVEWGNQITMARSTLAALDSASGSPKWSLDSWAMPGDLAVASGIVYVSSLMAEPPAGSEETGYGSMLSALDAATGQKKWEVFSPDRESAGLATSLSVANGYIYSTDKAGTVRAFDASDGAEKWRFRPESPASRLSVGPDGTVFAGTEHALYALNGKTGQKEWKLDLPGGIVVWPAITGDVLYVFCEDRGASEGRFVLGVNTTSGQELWRYQIPEAGPLYTEPSVADGVLYFQAGKDEYIYALGGQ